LLAPRERGGIASGNQTRCGRLDVAFNARDLAGEEEVGTTPRLPRRAKHRRAVDVRVAMHEAEAHELGMLEPGDQREHACLLSPFELRLKAHKAEVIARDRVLTQLHRGVRRTPTPRIDETDRLHRAEAERIASAMRHHFDRKTSLEEDLLLEVVDRRGF